MFPAKHCGEPDVMATEQNRKRLEEQRVGDCSHTFLFLFAVNLRQSMPLPVKPLSSHGVIWGDVSPCHDHARHQPAVSVCSAHQVELWVRRGGEKGGGGGGRRWQGVAFIWSSRCNLHLSKFNWWLLIRCLPLKTKIVGIVIFHFDLQKEFLMQLMRRLSMTDYTEVNMLRMFTFGKYYP